MKKTRNYTRLFLIFFIVALLGMNAWKAVGKENRQFVLDCPKIPLMRISNLGTELTDLRGYRSEGAQDYAKNTVIPLGKSKKLTISLGSDLEKVSSLTYEIIRKKDQKLIADGTIREFTNENGYLNAQMTVDDDLKEETDYMICFSVSIPRQGKVYYYAQLKYGLEFHSRENMEFVKQLHEQIFSKSEQIIDYIKSEDGTADNDFSKTTIESSYKTIIFGNAQPQAEGEISYSIKDVEGKKMKIELTYIMSIQRQERSKQYYRVEEIYEVSYSAKKMQLTDYERQVESLFNPEFVYTLNQEILLGITKKDIPDYLESDFGKKICFVQGRQLWLYNYRKNTMTEVFAFGGNNLDIRSNFDQNNIRLLNMDDDGNIDFLVYGYMSRGEHEGEYGISLYHYDTNSCLIEEKIFINSNYKYSILNSGIRKVAYLGHNDNLYILLNGILFKINIASSEVEKIEENIAKENITVSEKCKMVAIQKKDAKNSKKIVLWNLEKGQKQEITCEDNQRIKMIGFISEDFVYGTANKSDLSKSGSIFPMKQIRIINEEGEKIKTYKKENRYLLKVKISGNVIRVVLGKKKETKYQKIPMQEYIRYQNSDADKITFIRHFDNIQWSQLYIKFPSYVYVQNGGKVRKAGILR